MSESLIQTKKKPSFINNPRNRALFYQLLLLFGLGYFFYSIISNTLTNMEERGIKSGYDFLSSTSGFDILMTLIPYDATSSYFHTFVVGMLNTMLVSVIGIFFATLIGFLTGIAYFSNNWLIKKSSIVYVETFRNIPLLLQVFFWYSAVLATLPSARNSISIGEAIFLNIRGLYIPKAINEPLAVLVYIAFGIAVVGVVFLKFWAKKRQDLTGKQFPVLYASIGLLIGLPLLVSLLTGIPLQAEYPVFQVFNFKGGITIIPQLIA